MTEEPPALVLRDAGFRYPGSDWQFRHLHQEFLAGTTTSIMGRSGSGKSTLVSLLGILRRPTEGQVIIGGVPSSGAPDRTCSRLRRERIGFVFQEPHLPLRRPVWKAVAVPMMLIGHSRSSARAAAFDALRDVGLGGLELRRPDQLSGGQRQRCAVARALVTRPAIVIADEPTGSLDERTADVVVGELLSLASEQGAAVVVVTHDLAVARRTDTRLTLRSGSLQ